METWADYAAEGRACLLQHNYERLNQLVNANFDLRAPIYEIDPGNLEMVHLARKGRHGELRRIGRGHRRNL